MQILKSLNKNISFCFILILFQVLALNANNTLGGDITWSCSGTGNYIFKLRLHVQCGGPALPVIHTLNVFNHPTLNSIPVNLISQTDISPVCALSGPGISCVSGGPGAVTEYIYLSAQVAIPGVPPPGGWILTYSECCRNSNTNLNVNASTGLTLYSKILPYFGSNTNPCTDNSVDFLSAPESILCTSQSQSILFFPYDPDLDSISSRWAEPMNYFSGSFTPPVNPTPIAFISGYTFSSPFPNTGTGNTPAVLEPLSGKISFTSQVAGDFTYALIFESWRCGIKVSEVYKEFQIALNTCNTNSAPVMSIPFSGGYETTIVAGSILNFNLTATDLSTQSVSWEAAGEQFGTGFINSSSGCTNPPCATLTPPPPSPANGNNAITFNWQTDCLHLGSSTACTVSEKTYRFYITAKDDACQVPAVNNQVIVVHLVPPSILPSPEIKCISAGISNTITLSWNTPSDPNNTFSNYTIYHSSNISGPFDTLAVINNYNQTQLSFVSPSGTLNDYYFIKSFGCSGYAASPPKDTVKPITLTVNNPSNGTAQLFWNSFTNPLPITSCGWYKIFKEYPTGVWTLIDSTQNLNYTDTITICQALINYRIEICDNSGCSSVSNTDGDIFLDQTDPVTPLLDSVSIDGNGNAVLGWQASSSADVFAYVIYQKNGSVYVPVDTIYGNTTFAYTYFPSNASAGSETYVIAAYDSCGNISNLSSPQNTMFLTKQYDICNFTSILNWNPYINMSDGGLGQYEVLVSVNGGSWNLLGTTASNTFIHDSLTTGSTYCYKVVARSNGGNITSVSNQQCLNAVSTNSPNYLYVSRVTVNSGIVQVDGQTDNSPSVSISGFDVYRSNKTGTTFSLIGFINYTGSSTFSFNDNDVNTNTCSYYYYLVSRDSCLNQGIASDTSRTILCNAYTLDDYKNKIIWNDYSKWLGGVTIYNIYRSIDDVLNTLPIATIPYSGTGNNSYTDDVSGLITEEGKFEYFIEAIEGPGNPYGILAASLSNRATVYRDAEIFVPNAFAPRGANKVFKPVSQFIDHHEYSFSIYDRWGQKIWETNLKDEGWDGNGMTGGVYIWIIQYKNSRGEYFEKKGHVVLIR